MDENLELLKYIYKNSEMGSYTCNILIKDLNGKENNIKKIVEGIIKGYENFQKESKHYIKKYDVELEKNGLMAKMGSSMGISKEVKSDNSDSAIAQMLIEGITMGVVEIGAKIDRYEKNNDKKIVNMAKDFLSFQQESIDFLKKYL